jgi:DNA-binding transcriptional LysR family regulator
MDSISALLAFVRTAEAGSIVGAARVLGLSASAVGKRIARLEQELGTRLFQRTTRRVHLTDEGELLLQRCRRALDELSEAQADLAQRQHAPSGLLRIGLPTIGYRFLLPVLPGFQQRYPQVQLELDFNDRIVDVVSEGLDAVIRSGELADSSLTARRLGAFVSSSVRRRAICRCMERPAMWATCACIPRCASVTPPRESCIRGSCRASKAMPGRAFPRR